jgi:SAM-dependent methyltransferase
MASDLKEAASQFSAVYPVMDNADLRRKRGLKIASILREALGGRRADLILDVGCSNALVLDTVAAQLNPRFAVGIDMDAAVAPAPTRERVVVVGDAMALPLAPECVDVVICNHTYEHVPDPERLFAEIGRVLKPGGIVYFSAMNARWPMEPHYHLPFIHWLPAKLSARVLQHYRYSSGYLEKPLSTPALRKLVSAFELQDYTIRVIAQSQKYHAEDLIRMPWLGRLYELLARIFYGILPGYLWILTKPGPSRAG